MAIDIIKQNFEIAVKVVSCSCCQELLNCETAVRKMMMVRLCYCNDLFTLFLNYFFLHVMLPGAAQLQALEGVEVIAKLKAKKTL